VTTVYKQEQHFYNVLKSSGLIEPCFLEEGEDPFHISTLGACLGLSGTAEIPDKFSLRLKSRTLESVTMSGVLTPFSPRLDTVRRNDPLASVYRINKRAASHGLQPMSYEDITSFIGRKVGWRLCEGVNFLDQRLRETTNSAGVPHWSTKPYLYTDVRRGRFQFRSPRPVPGGRSVISDGPLFLDGDLQDFGGYLTDMFV
jgi:hypothetical protein